MAAAVAVLARGLAVRLQSSARYTSLLEVAAAPIKPLNRSAASNAAVGAPKGCAI